MSHFASPPHTSLPPDCPEFLILHPCTFQKERLGAGPSAPVYLLDCPSAMIAGPPIAAGHDRQGNAQVMLRVYRPPADADGHYHADQMLGALQTLAIKWCDTFGVEYDYGPIIAHEVDATTPPFDFALAAETPDAPPAWFLTVHPWSLVQHVPHV